MRISKRLAALGAVAAIAITAGMAQAAPTSAWQGEPPMKDGGWHAVSVDTTALIMADSEGAERHGSEARMWVAILFNDPQDSKGGAYSALLTRSSFDCSAQTWHPLHMRTLDAGGGVLASFDASSAPVAKADGGQEKLLAIACNPASVGADSPAMNDLMVAREAYVELVKDGKIT